MNVLFNRYYYCNATRQYVLFDDGTSNNVYLMYSVTSNRKTYSIHDRITNTIVTFFSLFRLLKLNVKYYYCTTRKQHEKNSSRNVDRNNIYRICLTSARHHPYMHTIACTERAQWCTSIWVGNATRLGLTWIFLFFVPKYLRVTDIFKLWYVSNANGHSRKPNASKTAYLTYFIQYKRRENEKRVVIFCYFACAYFIRPVR